MLFNPLPSILRLIFALLGLTLLAAYGWSLSAQDVPMDLLARQQPPSLVHWFGTDQMGRDLWLRAFQGTLTSLELGISTALCSGLLAMVAASVSLIHPRCDAAVRMVIDAMLALILCAEARRIACSDYVVLARCQGMGALRRWRIHLLPGLLPQWFIGTLLMFPHAVLHSAALSFLGFGLAAHEASLGLLLADALRYLAGGGWWLALFPGLMLLLLVLLFDQATRALQQLLWHRSEPC
ncbi:ABC transporter permease [Aeromonas media]|uniref:ABC transporter permease n=1 Tax=Aeromonas media TaxID=651 RepID=A0AAE7AIB5_AERME|nr:ABC transporter permease subunit [Aeromonas media]MBS4638924.1 ABC transporter permease [Aeromonas media]QJT30985.1 ABC transporter permease [Aeromonas media]